MWSAIILGDAKRTRFPSDRSSYNSHSKSTRSRLTAAPGLQYGYDSRNKRVWSATSNGQGQLTGQRAYFYGVDGAMLGVYTLTLSGTLTASPSYLAVYFRGKRVAVAPNGTTFSAFNQDRLGSQGTYYPYGELIVLGLCMCARPLLAMRLFSGTAVRDGQLEARHRVSVRIVG